MNEHDFNKRLSNTRNSFDLSRKSALQSSTVIRFAESTVQVSLFRIVRLSK